MLFGEHDEKDQDNEVVNACESVEVVRGVEDGDFCKYLAGNEKDVEQYEEDQRVQDCRLFDLVDELDVAGNFELLPACEVISKNLLQLFPTEQTSDIDRLLVLVVPHVSVDSFLQHPLHYILMPVLHCQDQRSLSLVVSRVVFDVFRGKAQQVSDYGKVAPIGRLMERSLSLIIQCIWVKRQFSISVLKEERKCFKMVIFDNHKEQILLLVGSGPHVGAVSLEEFDHFDVAVESCEVEGGHAVVVGHVDPGPELVLEGGVVLALLEVFPREGFKVQDIDL